MTCTTELADRLRTSCRRLFLRNFRPINTIGLKEFNGIRVNAEIYVDVEDSPSKNDLLSDVIDYNVMRDTIILYLDRGIENFAEAAVDHLLSNWSIRAAEIKVSRDNIFCYSIFKDKLIR
ncbi:hypothetical protein [Paraburkholderia tropica]|uniref:hypothetical protein n=1 Tax=Paraburkholderia tropica TaxID=92647 RepID=UPI000F54FF1D|nr:hypothetical protein [Paraburkholderia tropica]RQN37255.1 hypothetical protein EHZ25_20100 [Paraburkholderia tropica]